MNQPTRQKLGNQPLPPPGAGVRRDTGRDPRVHVKRERAGHLAVPESPPVHHYGPPQPLLQPFPLCQTLLDRGSGVHTLSFTYCYVLTSVLNWHFTDVSVSSKY